MTHPINNLVDAFVKMYGEINDIYPEDDWSIRLGVFAAGWNSALNEQNKTYSSSKKEGE